MNLFLTLLIAHIAVAFASTTLAAFSLAAPKVMSDKLSALWVGYGATIMSGVGLFIMVPSTLGRSCLMMAILTPLVIAAHYKIRATSLQTS